MTPFLFSLKSPSRLLLFDLFVTYRKNKYGITTMADGKNYPDRK